MKTDLKNKWFTLMIGVLLLVVLIAGIALIASGIWDRDEPSVPLSYFTDELQPGIVDAVDKAVESRLETVQDDLDASLADYQQVVDQKLTNDDAFVASVSEATAAMISDELRKGYQRISVDAGEQITVMRGAEIILLSGEAVCSGDTEQSLIDLTDGTILTDMKKLSANHLYLAHMEQRDLLAQSDLVLFIRGSFTAPTDSDDTDEN